MMALVYFGEEAPEMLIRDLFGALAAGLWGPTGFQAPLPPPAYYLRETAG